MLLHRRVSLLSRYYRLKCHPPRVNFSLNGKDNKEKSTTPVTTPVTTPIKTNESSTFSLKAVSDTCKSIAVSTVDMIKDPAGTWKLVKDTANHYWMGTKLLCTEIKMARQILGRVLQGSSMTRRERMQLIRTTMDIFRLVPFAVFVIVPFMEFLLPFALKLFPNMLPSTFQDELKKEENMKQELQMRLAVAGFLQETLQEMAARSSKASEAQDLVKFIQKARKGESLPNESVIKIASLFKDELTLANIPRPQLVSMCQFMGINPYGGDNFLRFQLRSKFRMIKDDDKRILWEGIEGLNLQELRDACQVRGMRAHGLSRARYMKQLKEWIDLSIQKSIPISLLIMSRAFVITSSDQQAEDILMSSISSLDSDTINEVVLAAASPAEENTVDIRKRKLESLQFQKEMIAEELEEVQEAKTKTMDKQKAISNESTLKAQDSTKILTESKVSEPKDLEESKFVTTTKDERSVKELTVAELEAIGDLTRLSAVQREKAKLAILEANIDAVEATKVVPVPENIEANQTQSIKDKDSTIATANDIATLNNESDPSLDIPVAPIVPTAVVTTSDRDISRVRSVLDSMVNKLKVQIDTTEKALGDKFRLLDLDDDGELSAEELKSAITKILKRSSSPEEIDEFFQALDADKDGKISVVELLRYAEEKRRHEEADTWKDQNSPN